MTHHETLKTAIRDIPDYPVKGVLFKDITPILMDPALFNTAVNLFAARLEGKAVDKLALVESRGFLFGSALARELGVGIIPVRKKGKLPYHTIEASYDLEYGSATLEIHRDALSKGERVVIFDDLLATGGTAGAAVDLIERLGGEVLEIDFLVELSFLGGREKLSGYEIYAPLVF